MKKVLIVANLYHASPRVPGLASYLPEFGWQTTILTPPIDRRAQTRFGFPEKLSERVRIIEAPYPGDIFWFWRKFFKLLGFKEGGGMTEQIKAAAGATARKSFLNKLLNLYQSIFGYPDTEKTWFTPALRAARRAMAQEKFDAVLSSSPYPTSHFVAKKIKELYKIPWVADFRDPWSQNHAYAYPWWRKKLDERLERRTMKSADAITAASPSYSQKESEFLGRRAETITNGFDPALFNEAQPPLTKNFTLTYTGSIYSGKQDPVKLFTAVRGLIDEGTIDQSRVEIRFYGRTQSWLETEILRYRLRDIVTQHGLISQHEAVDRQRESQVLILFGWEDPAETGVYPLKTFEYLAAQRPILVTGGTRHEDIKKIIVATRSGLSAISVSEIEQALGRLYNEYRSQGAVSYRGAPEKIEQYSYRMTTKKFAEILNSVV